MGYNENMTNDVNSPDNWDSYCEPKQDGLFIDLACPLDGRKDGPSFGFSDQELLGLFEERGFKQLSRNKPADSIPRRKGAEELFIFQKIA